MIRKKTNYHVAKLFLPEGVGSNGTTSDLFTMSKYRAVDPVGSTQPNLALCHTRISVRRSAITMLNQIMPFEHSSHGLLTLNRSTGAICPAGRIEEWWSQTGSNRRHPACKAGALPAELWPHFLVTEPINWLARVDSNHRPHAYQACALTT